LFTVHITEMDVRMDGNSTLKEKEIKQAEIYAGILQACLSQPNCKSFEMWGFSDAISWAAAEQPDIFDSHFQPKPAFWSLVSALQQTIE